MATLLLRLAAPLQAWGAESKFETRRTEKMPTKSGVVGLLAAALGRKRYEAVDDLAALRFGVRIDQEGVIIKDFQTAKSVKASYITYRFYISDAVFLVGLESEDAEWLSQLEKALSNPVFPLFLGRRACTPSLPLVLGIVDKPLVDALRDTEWQASEVYQRKHPSASLQIFADALDGENGGLMRDVPVSFNPERREFTWRRVHEHDSVRVGTDEHDPMLEL